MLLFYFKCIYMYFVFYFAKVSGVVCCAFCLQGFLFSDFNLILINLLLLIFYFAKVYGVI